MRSRLRDESGYTLVEMLVALTLSLLVVAGASALILFALNTQGRVAGRIEVTQSARTGLETLVQEMNSGCLVNDVSPVMASSSAGITPVVDSGDNDLVFVSGLGDSTTDTPTEHVVSLQGTSLVDSSYANTGGGPPSLGSAATWTFASTPQRVQTLVQNVSADQSDPIFQYFSYADAANPNQDSLLNATRLPTPVAANAPSVAEVGIDLVANPTQSADDAAESATFTNAVTFRFTAAAAPTADEGTEAYPCD